MDAYSRSVAQIELLATQNGQPVPCGLATGFFYKRDDTLYLITNWHVVTGIDPTTMMPVEDGPLPETLVFYYKQSVVKGKPTPGAAAIANFPKQLNLYEAGYAAWYEHSTRQNVDVVALKLSQSDLGEFANIPVNEVDQSPELEVAAGMDCFVLGYPEGMIGPGRTPIWKRGSIASEPKYNWREKPGFLIDTATRKGMSGAPVVARHSGILKVGSGPGLSGGDIIGTVTKFAGIYSGRIGDDLMGVQLGMVWSVDVLDDILSGRTRGMNPLR
jgi:Trypsin-like peptidase domain